MMFDEYHRKRAWWFVKICSFDASIKGKVPSYFNFCVLDMIGIKYSSYYSEEALVPSCVFIWPKFTKRKKKKKKSRIEQNLKLFVEQKGKDSIPMMHKELPSVVRYFSKFMVYFSL